MTVSPVQDEIRSWTCAVDNVIVVDFIRLSFPVLPDDHNLLRISLVRKIAASEMI